MYGAEINSNAHAEVTINTYIFPAPAGKLSAGNENPGIAKFHGHIPIL
jgi:hypothetical protein